MPTLLPPTKRRIKPTLMLALDFAGIGVLMIFTGWLAVSSLVRGTEEITSAVEYLIR